MLRRAFTTLALVGLHAYRCHSGKTVHRCLCHPLSLAIISPHPLEPSEARNVQLTQINR